MNKTKVISVRIDEQLLAQIDEKVSHMTSRKRNDLICGLLRLANLVAKTYPIERFCYFYPEWGDVLDDFVFEFHRGHKK